MLNFLKPKSTPEISNEAEGLVEALAQEDGRIYPFKLKNFPTGEKILQADPETQRQVALSLLAWLENDHPQPGQRDNWGRHWKMQNVMLNLLNRRLPFSEEDVLYFMAWSVRQSSNYARGVPQMIKILGNYLGENSLTDALSEQLQALIEAVEGWRPSVQERRWIMQLRELAGDTEIRLPLVKGDVWVDFALAHIHTLDEALQNTWAEFLLHCMRTNGSKPSKKWMQKADAFIKSIGRDEYRSNLLDWFPLVSEPRPEPAPIHPRGDRDNMVWYLEPLNSDILKGLIWTVSQEEDPEMARVLSALAITTYKKIPGVGPRAGKVGNACFWTLGEMPGGMDGIAQLSILKLRIKARPAQKSIAAALASASMRVGISADEIEELSVPDYGMGEVGIRREEFEGYTFELKINGSEVEQVWKRKDAKVVKSVPKAVREMFPEELKAVKQAVKDIRKMLPAQRDRIDNLFLAQKKWGFNIWRERYIDHPLVGTIARRLIWKFSREDRAASGIWHEDGFVERDGRPLAWLDDETTVELWHPINVEPEIVLEWREWLAAHEVQQPFKQAHREVYILSSTRASIRTAMQRTSCASTSSTRCARRAAGRTVCVCWWTITSRLPRRPCQSGTCVPNTGSKASAIITGGTPTRPERISTLPPTRSVSIQSMPTRMRRMRAEAAIRAPAGTGEGKASPCRWRISRRWSSPRSCGM